ncbi:MULTISPECIES: type I methionyl aminopeptidase [Anaerotruncus]|uniref:type I methionyl aminopeptidase n=1 Tax=Anaerotruncus TaxID=244127 RepID=UPI00082A81DE|nr:MULTISPECIES: type I methionyl aminopeptidase [Anaerotruncus]RGX56350.1 type I methionyl aminopeptidase [Anaerotruncus sp. AF02-27]
MVVLKTSKELAKMRKAGSITAQALQVGGAAVKPGVTTGEIDRIIKSFILSKGAKPSFLGYGGFPGSACISVNDEVIHGIPGKRVIQEGDIVSIDVGAVIDGYQGDTAGTFAAGRISDEAQRLMDATRESLLAAMAVMQVGARLGDIGHAVQSYVEPQGYGVVREYVGHGIGREMHEEPEVPNYGRPGHGIRLVAGMVLAVEPMITQHGPAVKTLSDGWTVVTVDHGLAAHFENTIAITADGPVILTQP